MSNTVPVFADVCQVATGSYNQQGYAGFLNVQVEGVDEGRRYLCTLNIYTKNLLFLVRYKQANM